RVASRQVLHRNGEDAHALAGVEGLSTMLRQVQRRAADHGGLLPGLVHLASRRTAAGSRRRRKWRSLFSGSRNRNVLASNCAQSDPNALADMQSIRLRTEAT